MQQKPDNSAKTIAYDYIMRKLTTNELMAGDAISEEDTALALGISRTPVREAILILQTEGYVDVYPKYGSFVHQFSLAEIMDIYNFRLGSEPSMISSSVRLLSTENRQSLVKYRAYCEEHVGNGEMLQLGSDFLNRDFDFHRFMISLSNNLFYERFGLIAFTMCIIAKGRVYDRLRTTHDHIARQHLDIIDSMLSGDSDRCYKEVYNHLNDIRERFLSYYIRP